MNHGSSKSCTCGDESMASYYLDAEGHEYCECTACELMRMQARRRAGVSIRPEGSSRVWVTRDGTELLPSEMSTDHLQNSLNMIARNSAQRLAVKGLEVNERTIRAYAQARWPVCAEMEREFLRRI